MPRVVFVADDLGCSAGVNQGIARAAAAGLLREASLMVTGAAVADGVRIGRDHGLGLGLHQCLTQGRALGGAIAGLTDAEGRFRGLGPALRACLRGRVDLAAAAREIDAQLDRLQQHGIAPTHLNGHHHVHVFPGLRQLACAAAAARGIGWLRLPAEPGCRRPGALLLRWLSARTAPLLRRHGLRHLPFAGYSLENRRDHGRRFDRLLRRLDGDSECMLHPRLPDAEFAQYDARGGRRDAAAAAELATLTGPGVAARLAAAGIVPAAFADCG